MPPYQGGGSMIARVELQHSTYADGPGRFEAGTPNIADVVAFGAAITYLTAVGMEAISAHEQRLTRQALAGLAAIPAVDLYGPVLPAERSGVVAFNLRGVHPHDVATVLDYHGIAVRAGHHCAQPLMRSLNVAATVRASFALYNSEAEIDALCEAVDEAGRLFRGATTP
jgi:cysteine desulfurase / selenocysteine lyase